MQRVTILILLFAPMNLCAMHKQLGMLKYARRTLCTQTSHSGFDYAALQLQAEKDNEIWEQKIQAKCKDLAQKVIGITTIGQLFSVPPYHSRQRESVKNSLLATVTPQVGINLTSLSAYERAILETCFSAQADQAIACLRTNHHAQALRGHTAVPVQTCSCSLQLGLDTPFKCIEK